MKKNRGRDSIFKRFISGTSGFTLIELLVAVAITGILSVALMQLIHQTARALQTNQASSAIMTSLNMAASEMISDLRKTTFQHDMLPGSASYRFLGVDGDGKFEYQTGTPHCDLSFVTCPASSGEGIGSVDRLHFNILYSNYELKGDNASERAAVHYFVSNEATESLYINEQYRLIKKRDRHIKDDVETDGTMIPIVEDNISDLGDPVGLNIDYLSLRYLTDAGSWVNSWDSSEPPKAVEVALRGYDDEAAIDPVWYITTVSLGK